ncbi:MAG: type II toxin-antitoxin system YafQ family toxin [Treponema sp.]|nr:type II toxin-antitoxin system YafQ family toxin [Treponema sp.]
MGDDYKYRLSYASSFKKDLKSLSIDEQNETKEVIRKLAYGKPLEEKYHDHQLVGQLKEFRDCHIRPDLVLVYRIREKILELYVYRVGSHSKLYKK